MPHSLLFVAHLRKTLRVPKNCLFDNIFIQILFFFAQLE